MAVMQPTWRWPCSSSGRGEPLRRAHHTQIRATRRESREPCRSERRRESRARHALTGRASSERRHEAALRAPHFVPQARPSYYLTAWAVLAREWPAPVHA